VPRDFAGWVERRAKELRRMLNLQDKDCLDPYALARCLDIKILEPSQVQGISDKCLKQLLYVDPYSWSAGTLHLPGQPAVVVLNPIHADTRKRATLMEEIAHVHLCHTPSSLIVIKGITAMRSYKKSQEMQAYWTGAAALVPCDLMKHAQDINLGRESLANICGVSIDLVKFREKVAKITLN
jgi:IrrE N-terminal-like domain